MAIDPDVLAKQRIGVAPERSPEKKCCRCGRRTRDKNGVCIKCRDARMPSVRHLPADHIRRIIDTCRAELERRKAEIAAALETP